MGIDLTEEQRQTANAGEAEGQSGLRLELLIDDPESIAKNVFAFWLAAFQATLDANVISWDSPPHSRNCHAAGG